MAFSRMNDIQSATGRLSHDVLGAIFEYSCTFARTSPCPNKPYHDHYFLVSLAGVSSLWRWIILSRPQLWSIIRLGLNGRTSEGCLNLLRLYLTNSGKEKLDIAIYFPSFSSAPSLPPTTWKQWPDWETLIHPSVDATIVESLHRIRSLHLEGASTKWLSYTSYLPNLTHFTFSPNYPPRVHHHHILDDLVPVSFANSPRLSSLSICGYSLINLDYGAHWSTITSLHLKGVETKTCLEILSLCYNVQKFCFIEPIISQMQEIERIGTLISWSTPISRPFLRYFCWNTSKHQIDETELLMFKNLHLSSIRALALVIWSHGQQPSIREFCNRLPPTLSSIQLTMKCPEDEQREYCILQSFPPTLRLTELWIRCESAKSAEHVLHHLGNPDIFPGLKSLKISNCRTRPRMLIMLHPETQRLVLPAYCSEMFVQVKRVRSCKERMFPVELKDIEVQWTSETRAQLRALEVGWKLGYFGY
jgi:hypothetical protein